MGVRARVAEWPPKRDPPKDSPDPRQRSSPSGAGGGAGGGAGSSFKALQRFAARRRCCSKEVEFQDGWGRSPALVAPLRQRSSSEVTLSECDPEEAPSQPAPAGGTGAGGGAGAAPGGLYREYGSTSSIDVQGVPEQSFFEMLNDLRAKRSPREPGAKTEVRNGCREEPAPVATTKDKEKPRRRCPKDANAAGGGGGGGGESIFRKLRSSRGDGGDGATKEVAEEPKASAEPGKPWLCQKSFAHYDVQSLLFDLNLVAANRAAGAQRRNTTTGASAASVATGTGRHQRGGGEGTTGATTTTTGGALSAAAELPSAGSTEELNWKENLEEDLGDDTSNELLLSCPHFRNEIGGTAQRDLSFSKATTNTTTSPPPLAAAPSEVPTATFRPTNAGISVLEVAKELQRNPSRLRHHSVEHVDLGARYYREHFHGKEHSNYFGLDERLGPVAVSIRRE
ncbi:SI1L3 protein, partial [Psilopogon haemacephalus]|nr:SI1L3 protein [Psilopogon haemacephalus]